MRAESGPAIAPGGSFEAHVTPTRPGTFMYHTHMDDLWQLLGGLAGPLIVLAPGERFDPALDHIVMVTSSFAHPIGGGMSINGSLQPAPIVLHAGIPQRLRLLNMTAFGSDLVVSLDGTGSGRWTPIAKDGIDLDPRLQTPRTPIQELTTGETRDFRFVPAAPGTLKLDVFDGPAIVASVPIDVMP
jgi:FtsP/CotA-like multicopper oxidase with cupredoxin domain